MRTLCLLIAVCLGCGNEQTTDLDSVSNTSAEGRLDNPTAPTEVSNNPPTANEPSNGQESGTTDPNLGAEENPSPEVDEAPANEPPSNDQTETGETSANEPGDSNANEPPIEPSAPSEPQIFQEITDLFIGNEVKRRYGIAITDIDGDQEFEAVVTGYGSANEVWDFRDGRFVDVSPDELKDPSRRAIGVSACDMDGDGREEIYFLNVDRFGGLGDVSDRLYRRSPEGWVDIFEADANVSAVNRFSGRSVACFDRDGDGAYGIFVANYGGPMKLFEADDAWRLSDMAPAMGMALTTGGRSLINLPGSNGEMRLFAGNENGPNFFFVPSGNTYENVAADYGIADPFETVRGVAVLDADEDGHFDLVYGNWNGPHRLFLSRDGAFQDVATEAMAAPSRIRTVIAADFDNDGYEELFWNQIGQPNRLFKKTDGEWVAVDIGPALEPEGLGTGAAVLDIDGDGRLELFIAHGESGAQPLSAFHWGRNDNHFLRVQPLTPQGGPARGAVVKIRSADREQRRAIDAGSGYLCQMEPVAHFGLGQEDTPVSVEVLWTDGTRATLQNVDVDQVLVVSYPQD